MYFFILKSCLILLNYENRYYFGLIVIILFHVIAPVPLNLLSRHFIVRSPYPFFCIKFKFISTETQALILSLHKRNAASLFFYVNPLWHGYIITPYLIHPCILNSSVTLFITLIPSPYPIY